MITSKELLERAGISRATLNNYISLGILARPTVLSAVHEDIEARRIGFFSKEAISIIENVRKMKKQGMSMNKIATYFKEQPEDNEDNMEAVLMEGGNSAGKSKTTITPQTVDTKSLTVDLDVEKIPGPAYMVNNNFEVVWWNGTAENILFDNGLEQDDRQDVKAKNLFRLLSTSNTLKTLNNYPDLLEVHLSAAKKRLPRENLAEIYPHLSRSDMQMLDELYEKAEMLSSESIVHYPLDLTFNGNMDKPFNMYVSFFREGIFFTYIPMNLDNSTLLELLSRRDHVIRDLLKKRKPFLTDLVTMVADLQNSVQICAELPPDEYFELINNIWQSAEPIFRKHYGTHGKHAGDGMVYYFFPQPDCNYVLNSLNCSYELGEMMKELSKEWQSRKNWLQELYLNIGLDEGREWFGTYYSDINLEFTVLGDTINYAARISGLARNGSVWATKNMLSRLSPKERQTLRYGIRHLSTTGEEIFVKETYSRVSGLVDLSDDKNIKFSDITTIPVTEIIDINCN